MTNLDETAEQLERVLRETFDFLTAFGDETWAARIRQAIDGRVYADQILGWFGGMGTFNDLLISPVNGHRIREEDAPSANQRLHALQDEIYRLAKVLARASR